MKALRAVRAAGVPRTGLLPALVALALIVAPTSLLAQTVGNPMIYSPDAQNGTAVSTAYIDAYTATSGSDICARINTAWGMVLGQTPTGSTPPNVNSVTVDARGFTGSWTCAVSPFSPTGTSLLPNGVVLLGNAIITTSMTWLVSSRTSLIGIGTGNTTVIPNYGVNTVIQAADSLEGPVLQMGSSMGGPWFGIVIRDLTVDCHAVAGCTGIFNNEAEENSMVDRVQIWDAPLFGLHVSAANGSDTLSPGATNSGPYRNIYISYTANCTSCTGAVGVQVDGPGSQINGISSARSIREFNDITVTGRPTGSFLTGAAVVIYGVSTAFTNSHLEYAQTGIAIGDVSSTSSCIFGTITGNCVTRGVEVSNVSIATLTNGQNQTAIIIGNLTQGAPATYDVTLIGIVNQNPNSKSKTLQDNTSGATLKSLPTPYIGLYALGDCTSTQCKVVKNNSQN